ncbi:hypothetical protein [Desulfonatronum thiodismutans]|nr:hypothetical protein [Desulfonatronum thiodismutans]
MAIKAEAHPAHNLAEPKRSLFMGDTKGKKEKAKDKKQKEAKKEKQKKGK